jgi:hypothetical protein
VRSRAVESGHRTLSIPISKSEVTLLNELSFKRIFIPLLLNKALCLTFDEVVSWIDSDAGSMHDLGLQTLVRRYRNDARAWEILLDRLRRQETDRLSPRIIPLLALIPGHPDIFWHSENVINEDVRAEILTVLRSFTEEDVLKCLAFVDQHGFSRGAIGQHVAAVLSTIQDKFSILKRIARSPSASENVRYAASWLLAEPGWLKYPPFD